MIPTPTAVHRFRFSPGAVVTCSFGESKHRLSQGAQGAADTSGEDWRQMFGSSWGSVLEACRAGAEWAWRQVYEDVAPSLLRYHRARGTPDPEDLVGDTFVRVVRGLAGFEGNEEQFRAWVFTISRRRAIDLARTSARRPEKPDTGDGLTGRGGKGNAEDDAMRSLEEQRVRVILDRLTPDQRDVLLLRVVSDLTVEQVATVVGKSAGAVKALQARGLEQVRREISRGAVTF